MKLTLTNSWMANGTVDAQIAHFFAAYSIVVTSAYLSHNSFPWVIGISTALVLYAALKEFWFDANYELPRQTNFDNILDFTFYVLGTAVGFVEFLLAR